MTKKNPTLNKYITENKVPVTFVPDLALLIRDSNEVSCRGIGLYFCCQVEESDSIIPARQSDCCSCLP